MAQGFCDIQILKDNNKAIKTAELFQQVFGKPWKPSTYSDNLHTWKMAPSDVIAASVNLGRTEAGEWGHLVQRYNKKSK